MIKVKCQRCKHIWNYKGKKTSKQYIEFVSCPKCKTSVRLEELK